MSQGTGNKSYVGFGGEVTVGSKGTIDLFHRCIDFNLEHEKSIFAPETENPDWDVDLFYSGGQSKGSLVFEQTYTGLELFYYSLFGTYTYSVSTPVVGANTHLFSFAPATNAHPSISIEGIRGIGGSKECSYLGMYVKKAVIEFGIRKPMRTTFEVVGMGESIAAATSPTFPTFAPVVPAHLVTLTLNGTALSVLSGRVEMTVPRDEGREHYGAAIFKEPIVVGRPQARFSFECEYGDTTGMDSDAMLVAYRAGTKLSALVLQHQGDIVTGSTKKEFRLNSTAGYIEKATPAAIGKNKVTGVTISGIITGGLTTTFINATTTVS